MSRINPPQQDATGDMPLDAAPVIVEIEDAVATVTLNRPAKRNAVTFAMWGALAERVTELAANPDVRVLVVRGAGDHFCAGADITEFGKPMVEPGLPATAPVEVTDGPLTASGELLAADIAAVE